MLTALRGQRLALAAGCALLALAILMGGGTRQGLAADQLLQMLSLPLLWLALMRLHPKALDRGARLALAWLLLMATWIALQLLPLPPTLWMRLPERAAIAADLAAAGVAVGWRPITFDATATLRAALAWLPPIALALAALGLDSHSRVRMVQALLLICVFAILIGFAQLAGGQHSPLRWHTHTNTLEAVGPFANRNHFASLLALAVPLATAWIISATRPRPRQMAVLTHNTRLGVAITILVLLLVGIAVSRSRAGLLLAAVAVVLSAALAWRNHQESPLRAHAPGARRWLALAGLLGLVFGIQYGLVGLLDRVQQDPFEDMRWRIAANTLQAARALAPTGAGAGTFPVTYVQFEPAEQRSAFFVNRAHNDWAEWWLEGGLPMLLLLLVALLILLRATLAAWRSQGEYAPWRRAATFSVWLVLLHSLVDYPLRTTAIATVTALLLAIVFAARRGNGHAAQDTRATPDAGP
ncbi:MAG: O-antigen ligase family protein [Xanthomonadales bacterium]|nr:O-antigen ligase family protein [Xanthomonadales bacterium]MCC6561295.1 O-antigen ligase family protein [Xanthomonadales bacterium]